MSASPAAMQASTAQPFTVKIEGLLESVRQHQGRYFGLIVLPADGKYGEPQYIEVQADSPLGQVGTEVKVTCTVGGWRNNYTTKTGEAIRSAANRLTRV